MEFLLLNNIADKVLNKDCVNQVIWIQRFSFAQRKRKHRCSGRKTVARKHSVCKDLLCGMRYNSALAVLACQSVSWIIGYYFIYLFIFGCCGSSLLCRLSLVVASGVAVQKLLIAVASLVAEYGLQEHRLQQLQHVGPVLGLQSSGSIAMAHGLSGSTACGIFPDQGWNSCTVNWQANSYPLCHQANLNTMFFKYHVSCLGLSSVPLNKLLFFPVIDISFSLLFPPKITTIIPLESTCLWNVTMLFLLS